MSKHHGCSCKVCQSLCRHEPGWFAPGEAEHAADYLRIDWPTFLRDFLTEWPVEGGVALSPRFDSRRKACVFFKKGLCEIHDVKPFECRKVYGCEAGRRHSRIRDIIATMWGKK